MEPTSSQTDAAAPDYYVERGCVVFTAAYHLRRGYCCDSGCRHCPYGNAAEQSGGEETAHREAADPTVPGRDAD